MSFDRRIVFDTGVLLSAALRTASVPALALEKALLNFAVCASDATLKELAEVLMRSKFDGCCPTAVRRRFVDGFSDRVVRIGVSVTVTDCIDPKDNKFLELALDAEAELIVVSDTQLTSLHPWRGIPVMPPSAFLVGVR